MGPVRHSEGGPLCAKRQTFTAFWICNQGENEAFTGELRSGLDAYRDLRNLPDETKPKSLRACGSYDNEDI